MNMALSQSSKLKQRSPGNFEDENAWLQEWIHEELAHGEVWQKEYEALLRHQSQLCALLQTKSFKSLEKKTRALQEELEEIQEVLQEYQNRSRQRQLHIHKQEKENQKMAEIVKELEKKVFKQQLDEQYNKDVQKELRSEGNELKKQQHIEKLSTVIQGLSLKSQELHRSITFLEDNVVEVQQEIALLQKDALSGEMVTLAGGFLWEEQVCDQMKRLPHLELYRITSKEYCSSISFLRPTPQAAWRMLWALAKVLFLILLLALPLHFFHGRYSRQPCLQRHSTPLLYIESKRLFPL
ncbi:centromere-associated protein E-like isoform X5 [Crotalus tigris]|uniref:centromere-associated protein E-like isoform X5 n=1 Tax=Crotalus tigris TaxID=88082 RepID=UPI00192F7C67|nr:centromere-associated protein E-like isoform X5 [Crotalus tigris]XP_039205500.1 centromere-associated protein E-like isoform X5 [Crotalus tigris]XP_039205918.1 centromere-associated protein E-like isoform X5 [Crotalus tigris]